MIRKFHTEPMEEPKLKVQNMLKEFLLISINQIPEVNLQQLSTGETKLSELVRIIILLILQSSAKQLNKDFLKDQQVQVKLTVFHKLETKLVTYQKDQANKLQNHPDKLTIS